MEDAVRQINEIKTLHAAEDKELKNKAKKVNKKLKAIEEREAKLKNDRVNFEKIIDKTKTTHELEAVEDTMEDENKNEQVQKSTSNPSPSSCIHSPQCTLRSPLPPPNGPLTRDQFTLSQPGNCRENITLDYDSMVNINKEAIEDNENVVSNIPLENMFDTLKKDSNDNSTFALDLVSSSIDKTTTTSQVSLSMNTPSNFLTSTSPLTVLNPSSSLSSTLGNTAATPPTCRTAPPTGTAAVSQSQREFKNEILKRLYGRRN